VGFDGRLRWYSLYNTKNGNRYLAWAFSEAAEFIRRYNDQAKAFFNRKSAKRSRMVANGALAHKLARASYYIMRDGVAFDSSKLFAWNWPNRWARGGVGKTKDLIGSRFVHVTFNLLPPISFVRYHSWTWWVTGAATLLTEEPLLETTDAERKTKS